MDLQYVLYNFWWQIFGFKQIPLYENDDIIQMILITLLSLYT